MKELIVKIEKTVMDELLPNIRQNNNGNKAAGVRARKATLELEKLFKQYRKDSIEADKK